jgi:hypothetical protein
MSNVYASLNGMSYGKAVHYYHNVIRPHSIMILQTKKPQYQKLNTITKKQKKQKKNAKKNKK